MPRERAWDVLEAVAGNPGLGRMLGIGALAGAALSQADRLAPRVRRLAGALSPDGPLVDIQGPSFEAPSFQAPSFGAPPVDESGQAPASSPTPEPEPPAPSPPPSPPADGGSSASSPTSSPDDSPLLAGGADPPAPSPPPEPDIGEQVQDAASQAPYSPGATGILQQAAQTLPSDEPLPTRVEQGQAQGKQGGRAVQGLIEEAGQEGAELAAGVAGGSSGFLTGLSPGPDTPEERQRQLERTRSKTSPFEQLGSAVSSAAGDLL